jgi:hypothetical protein
VIGFQQDFYYLAQVLRQIIHGGMAIYAALRASETVPKGIIVPTSLVVNENPSAKGNLC